MNLFSHYEHCRYPATVVQREELLIKTQRRALVAEADRGRGGRPAAVARRVVGILAARSGERLRGTDAAHPRQRPMSAGRRWPTG